VLPLGGVQVSMQNKAELEAIKRGYAGQRVLCLNCMTIIQSQHPYDMHSCLCTEDEDRVWVDGGAEYLRFMYGSNAAFTLIDQHYYEEAK